MREQGQRLECRAFTMWWRQRPASPASTATAATPASPATPPRSRVCVIASTAAVGNAVHRNRAKRRLREIYRHDQAAVPPGCDLLLIARRAVNEWAMADLERKFLEACRHIAPAAHAS